MRMVLFSLNEVYAPFSRSHSWTQLRWRTFVQSPGSSTLQVFLSRPWIKQIIWTFFSQDSDWVIVDIWLHLWMIFEGFGMGVCVIRPSWLSQQFLMSSTIATFWSNSQGYKQKGTVLFCSSSLPSSMVDSSQCYIIQERM